MDGGRHREVNRTERATGQREEETRGDEKRRDEDEMRHQTDRLSVDARGDPCERGFWA